MRKDFFNSVDKANLPGVHITVFNFKNAGVLLIIHDFPINVFVLLILGYAHQIVKGL